jgi:hypothetical protein
MNPNELPPAELRRTVVVLGNRERRALLMSPEGADLIEEPGVRVIVREPGDPPRSALEVLLQDQNLLRAGLLIQSPYQPDRYVDASAALVEFTQERQLKLSEIAQALGATEIKVEEAKDESSAFEGHARAEMNAEFLKGGGSVDGSVKGRQRDYHRLHQSFPGSPPDLARAEEILRESGLAGDAQLLALINLRASGNPILEHEVHFSGLREAEGSLRICAHVSEGLGRLRIAGLSAEFAAEYKQARDVNLTTIIRF